MKNIFSNLLFITENNIEVALFVACLCLYLGCVYARVLAVVSGIREEGHAE